METLRKNSRGPLVELLQSVLNRMGFNSGTVDGIFGDRTVSAVIRFQNAVGLTADGIVGERTWNALMPYILGYFTVTVRQGDTFWRLAQQYHTSVTAIEAANPGVDPQNLQVGQRLTIPTADPVVITNISYSYEILQLNLKGLLARYPFLKSGSVGNSVLGRPIPFLQIGSGGVSVGYNGAHHANEWITVPVLMRFAEQLCRGKAFGQSLAGYDVRRLLEKITFWIVPMVNPDGVDLVTGGIKPDSAPYRAAQAMNTGLPFPSGWKANIRGVDLNLNYPANWEEAKRIKYEQGYTRPGPRDFVGEYPLSEPESVAMAEFTKQHDFRLILAYHTQGELIYWKYLNYEPENSLAIARQFAEVSGYAVEETPYGSGFAGYKDWFIQEYNRPGYTIEAGLGSNPLPISKFPDIWRDNVGILVLGGVLSVS